MSRRRGQEIFRNDAQPITHCKPVSVRLGGEVDLSWRVQAWSGAAIGLFAVKAGATADNYADFDSFTVTSLAK